MIGLLFLSSANSYTNTAPLFPKTQFLEDISM